MSRDAKTGDVRSIAATSRGAGHRRVRPLLILRGLRPRSGPAPRCRPSARASPSSCSSPRRCSRSVGLFYSTLYVFGTLIYLDPREYAWSVPINRASSVFSAAIASYALPHLRRRRPARLDPDRRRDRAARDRLAQLPAAARHDLRGDRRQAAQADPVRLQRQHRPLADRRGAHASRLRAGTRGTPTTSTRRAPASASTSPASRWRRRPSPRSRPGVRHTPTAPSRAPRGSSSRPP